MIGNEAFIGFLDCRRKAFLKQAGHPGEVLDIERVQRLVGERDRRIALDRFLGPLREGEVLHDPPSLEFAIQGGVKFIVAATAQADGLSSRLDLLERLDGGEGDACVYAPVLFVSADKVAKGDRLLLAFQAVVLSLVQGAVPDHGKIVSGRECKVTRVRLAPLVEEAREVISLIEGDSGTGAAPALTLNRHCAGCEFRKDCLSLAEKADDLSLLRSLSEKEIQRLRGRGVTTLTQFSHSYRPGRRGKRRAEEARKHDPALQALALREQKVYVMDATSLKQTPVSLYLDVEGVPDRDFYYLVGLLVVEEGRSTFHSFWADDASQEKAAWDGCLRIIERFPEYTLYHYGQYETRFLERMKERGGEGDGVAIDRVLARSCNALSAIYSHVYFPTRSNGLKDVATSLGFRWSEEGASGLQALAWRLTWELAKEESHKENLLRYNQEDCLALQRVTEFLFSVCSGSSPNQGASRLPVAQAEDLKHPVTFRLGKSKFFCPDLEHINKCAYSDYQREKVYVRTSPAVRRSRSRKLREGKRRPKVNQEVECAKPERCLECGNTRLHTFHTRPARKVISDLKFTRSGVKRWLVRYSTLRYQCSACRATVTAAEYRAHRLRVGPGLCAWAIYQNIASRVSHEGVSTSLNELFGFSFKPSLFSMIKPRLAATYRPTYEKLKEKLRGGQLVHADETKGQVVRHSGYVWAFTNLEEVVYVYTPTRDGDILEDVLNGFKGVLVSDFYSAYDAVECPQQKCLIHLIRDINDDLFHNPFDEELKRVAQKLVGILKPIIDTIDAHGLKRHFLHKHKKEAIGFMSHLAKQEFKSELANHYQKRVGKYEGKLFTFLDHDGVPWNNNNAEVAIKRFASRRRMMGASFSENGIQDYLVFLSIYQTCRNKNVSFLRFLRSGSLDLDAYIDEGGR